METEYNSLESERTKLQLQLNEKQKKESETETESTEENSPNPVDSARVLALRQHALSLERENVTLREKCLVLETELSLVKESAGGERVVKLERQLKELSGRYERCVCVRVCVSERMSE